jgi:glycerophosphoryl diester phosphodiesterase
MIKVIGHRGAAGYAPENTFASFDYALALAVDGLETDIRATRDGVLVLLHDATVDRTTDGTGAITELTWDQVRRLDAAARFTPAVPATGARPGVPPRPPLHDVRPQPIPRLDEFLDRYSGRTTFRLELKQPGVEAEVLRLVRARDLMEASVFTSFQPDILRALRQAAPEAQLAYLSSARVFDEGVIQTALELGVNEVAPRAELAQAPLVARARAAGLRVWAWGVKDLDTLRRAVAAGIGGCTLDYPDWARLIGD